MSWSSGNGPQRRSPRPVRLSSGQPLASGDDDRTCAAPTCGTKLSRYNTDTTCSRHGGWTDPPAPAALRGANRRSDDAPVAVTPEVPDDAATVDTDGNEALEPG